MFQRMLRGLAPLPLLMLLPCTALAHPHIYVECQLIFIFDQNGLAGIRQQWVFDELFTATILDLGDVNRNGLIDEDEVETTRREAFVNLRNFHYFTAVKIDGQDFPVEHVANFSAWMREDGKVAYSFYVPCPVPASHEEHEVKVAVYDESFYVFIAYGDGESGFDPFADPLFADPSAPANPDDFDRFTGEQNLPVPEQGLEVVGAVDRLELRDSVQAAPDMKYFFDQITPDACVLAFKQS